MILSGHQPVYLPGIILLTKISMSNIFMFVGHCEFGKRNWHSHNYIRTGKLTVPTHKGPSIEETVVCGDHWKTKHLKSISFAYGKYPFFKECFPELEATIWMPYAGLGALNRALIKLFLGWLEIDTEIIDHPFVRGYETPTEMLIQMCELVGADSYLSSPGEDYVDREQMAGKGITHYYQSFDDPDYGQRRLIINGVEQPLSALDLFFSKSRSEAGKIVREAGHVLD